MHQLPEIQPPKQPNEDSFRRKVVHAVVWRSGSQLLVQFLRWAATIYVIRLLTPSDYGLIAMTETLTALLVILSGESINVALVQRKEITDRMARQAFGLLIIINVCLALLQLGIAPLVAAYYQQPEIAHLLSVMAINYLILPFISLPQALCMRNLDFKTPALCNFIATIASVLSTLALALAGFGVWALVTGQIVMLAANAIGLLSYGQRLVWPDFRMTEINGMFRFSTIVMLTSLLWFVYTQSSILIVGRELGAHASGLYYTALMLAQLAVVKLIPALNEVGGSAYARIQHDLEAVASNFLRVVRLISLVTCPVYAGLAATAPIFVPTVLGAQWQEAVTLLQILCIAMPIYTLHTLLAPATNALGRPDIATYSTIAGLVVMPAAFWIGAQKGLTGVGLAWLFAFPIVAFVAARTSFGVLNVKFSGVGKAALPGLASAGAMGGLVWGLGRWINPLPDVVELVILALFGVITYLAMIRLLFPSTLADIKHILRR